MKLQKTFAASPKSWSIDSKSIDQETFDLSVRNPNGGEKKKHRTPKDILEELAALDGKAADALRTVRGLL